MVTEPPKPGASELDLERVHRDAGWLFSLAILSEACVALGEERGAARLCGLLLPFAGVYTVAPIEATFGSVACALGGVGRDDGAVSHLEAAVDLERRMRARPLAGPRQAAARDGAPRARHAAGSAPIDASAQFDATRGA